jgi:hypothetical protein
MGNCLCSTVDCTLYVLVTKPNHSTFILLSPSVRSLVSPGVEGEVVAPGKLPSAVPAPEGLGARVLAEVPGQLVGTRKAPLAAIPRTRVGLLA